MAISLGLDISLLERLITRPLYCRDEHKFADHGCYDPLLVTKLINNYRSHPSLLSLPSAIFYDAELKEFGDKKITESLCEWEMLPKKGFPLLFHGIKVRLLVLCKFATQVTMEALLEGLGVVWFQLPMTFTFCGDPCRSSHVFPCRARISVRGAVLPGSIP